ncbi:MAG: ribosomal protein methyltransferase [Solirubrobacterales bacterium]|jgi:ribosomal protein L11 methyltransferase|nr:ribosomal protein methyltransferase [Solirubrobacterales bacterium]
MIRLAVRCRPELAERVLADLLELAPGGVEEERGGDWVEYAIYGPPGEVPALPDLEAAAGEGLVEISSTEIPDDWADRWRDFHEPALIAGGRIVVRPSWETGPDPSPRSPAGEAEEVAGMSVAGISVVIDPGQAFGTGAHATTKMCLELLLELADAGEASGPLTDLGTGSGVLAIAAAKLGWDPVLGVDSEAASIEAATANAAANGVEIEFRRLNLREDRPPGAPTLVANLTAPLLEAVAAGLAGPPATLICSGLLASEAERVSAALSAAGLDPVKRRAEGDWAALLCRARESDSTAV